MKNWKRYILPAALLLVILICVCRPSARPDHDRPHVIRIENVDGKNRQVQVIQDGVELALLDGEPHNVAVNLEGTRAFFILAPGKFDPGTVYKVENGELTVLAENVDDIYMSQNFKAFYYTHGDDELSVWQEGKHTHLGKCDPILNYKTISPDGQIVGFTLHDAAYYYMDGKTVKFGDHMNWMAIADGGRYLYFRDTEAQKYYVQRGFDESTRMELPGMPGVMNSDLSQAMLSDYSPETGWHTWILVEGQKVMDLGDQGN